MIDEDGSYQTPPSSDLNAFNNIMVIKVENFKNSGQTSFQLATLDRSKEGTEWPADEYVSQLIPGLPKIKMSEEEIKAFKSRKELDLTLPLKTKAPRPKLFCEPDPNRYHFNRICTSNQSSSENFQNRFQSKPGNAKQKPLLANPWENQLGDRRDGRKNMTRSASPSERHFNLPNGNFTSFCPPSTHHNYSGPPPPTNNSFQNSTQVPFPSFSFYNKHRRYMRYAQKPKRFHEKKYPQNTSNRGSRHDSAHIKSYDYLEGKRDISGVKDMITPGYYTNNIVRVPPQNHVPDSRHDPCNAAFEGNYMQEMDNSVDHDGMPRTNSSIPHQAHYPIQSGREQWRNNTFTHPRQNMNLNPREMNLNSRKGGNAMSRGNRNLRTRNPRKPRYRGSNQNVHRGF